MRLTAACRLPTPWGEFQLRGLDDPTSVPEHALLSMGSVDDGEPVLVRMHSECLTGDGLFSLRCDCGEQLRCALQCIAAEGRGVLLYLRQEGRGIGLLNKIRAYSLQDTGADTLDANRQLGLPDDARDYAVAARMLGLLRVRNVRVLTNNPAKIRALASHGMNVVERVPLATLPNAHNTRYLATKATRMGHWLDSQPCRDDGAAAFQATTPAWP